MIRLSWFPQPLEVKHEISPNSIFLSDLGINRSLFGFGVYRPSGVPAMQIFLKKCFLTEIKHIVSKYG